MKKLSIVFICVAALLIVGFFVLQANSFTLMLWQEGLEACEIIDSFQDLDTAHRVCLSRNEHGQPVMFQAYKNDWGFWRVFHMGAALDPAVSDQRNFIWFTNRTDGTPGHTVREAYYGLGTPPLLTYPDSVSVKQYTYDAVYVICLTADSTEDLDLVAFTS